MAKYAMDIEKTDGTTIRIAVEADSDTQATDRAWDYIDAQGGELAKDVLILWNRGPIAA